MLRTKTFFHPIVFALRGSWRGWAYLGDFYNENGNKIGTDKINDGKKYVVIDKKEANACADKMCYFKVVVVD